MSRLMLIIAVLAAFNVYVSWRVLGLSGFGAWALAAAFFTLQMAAPFGDRLLFPDLRAQAGGAILVLDWASYGALGLLSCLLIYGVGADLLGLIWRLADGVDPGRRLLISVGLASAGTTVLGVGQAMAGPEVVSVDVPINGLPKGFDGFTIAQISDLHVGPIIGRDYVARVVERVMGLKADLIALTGDFVDGSVAQLASDVAPLAGLSAPSGCYYVTGNHEYYWGADRWLAHFASLGLTPLINAHRVLTRDGDQLVLAGIPDLSAGRFDGDGPDMAKTLEGAPPGLIKVLLAHQPASYEVAQGAGVDLQLSGHTHAGQYFPFSLFIGLFQRYYKGLNRHENLWIYVNRGTGFWGPPLRTANPSEITLLTLRAV